METVPGRDTRRGFPWNWLPANNTAGGILVGVKEDKFDIVQCDIQSYCISCILKFKHNYTVWRLVSVYGSVYEEHKLDFINELHSVLAGWSGPTLVGETLILSE